MWLHSLKSVREESSPLEINVSGLSNNTTLRLTSRPKAMPHGTPWLLWISAKIALPILANMESRRNPCDCQIHNASFVCSGFDGVRISIFAESNGAVIRVARKFLVVEVEVLEGIGGPEVWGFPVGIEDFRVELACGVYTTNMRLSACFSVCGRGSAISRNVAVDDLSHSNMPTIRRQIESLCLHTCRSHCSPL